MSGTSGGALGAPAPFRDRINLVHFQLGDVLKAVGPSASIVFAAWIFMGFLQQRSDTAFERYHSLVNDYRKQDDSDERLSNLRDQILVVRRRCDLMNRASTIGLASAIALILTLVMGALDVMVPAQPLIRWAGTGTAIAGLAGVIVATAFVIVEGYITQRQLDDELLDIPDLARRTGHEPGSIEGR